jgi:hypothetical protein
MNFIYRISASTSETASPVKMDEQKKYLSDRLLSEELPVRITRMSCNNAGDIDTGS